jgi:hypothetical protein
VIGTDPPPDWREGSGLRDRLRADTTAFPDRPVATSARRRTPSIKESCVRGFHGCRRRSRLAAIRRRAIEIPMINARDPTATFTAGERDYIRRELDVFFS